MTFSMNRRDLIASAGAFGASAALSTTAFAAAPMLGVARAPYYRFKLGAFEVTTINDGALQLPGPFPIFGGNATEAEVQDLAKANLLPPDQLEIPFTVTIVNTGTQLVLFDSGNGDSTGRRPNAGLLLDRLGLAGYKPGDIDVVAMTHFHPDHIGGLMEGGAPSFPNASYVMPAAEYNFWSPVEVAEAEATGRVGKLVQANVVPFAEKTKFVEPGGEVVPGITALKANGHTPGHTAYHVESNGARLVLIGDASNHYVVSLQRPDWYVKFDMDKEQAVASRKEILGMIAADKIPFIGYHMPGSAVGYLEASGPGFEFVPASYQLNFG